MKALPLLPLLFIALALMAFQANGPVEKQTLQPGTYGVCSAEIQIVALTLDEDFTFHYIDHSNREKPIEINGKWELSNRAVLLTTTPSDLRFPDKWKMDAATGCLTSRKGMAFYRLCHVRGQ